MSLLLTMVEDINTQLSAYGEYVVHGLTLPVLTHVSLTTFYL